MTLLQSWADEGEPKVMWLAGLHAPETYLAALVQMACRDRGWPLDRSTLYTQVTPYTEAGQVRESPRCVTEPACCWLGCLCCAKSARLLHHLAEAAIVTLWGWWNLHAAHTACCLQSTGADAQTFGCCCGAVWAATCLGSTWRVQPGTIKPASSNASRPAKQWMNCQCCRCA